MSTASLIKSINAIDEVLTTNKFLFYLLKNHEIKVENEYVFGDVLESLYTEV